MQLKDQDLGRKEQKWQTPKADTETTMQGVCLIWKMIPGNTGRKVGSKKGRKPVKGSPSSSSLQGHWGSIQCETCLRITPAAEGRQKYYLQTRHPMLAQGCSWGRYLAAGQVVTAWAARHKRQSHRSATVTTPSDCLCIEPGEPEFCPHWYHKTCQVSC